MIIAAFLPLLMVLGGIIGSLHFLTPWQLFQGLCGFVSGPSPQCFAQQQQPILPPEWQYQQPQPIQSIQVFNCIIISSTQAICNWR